MSYQRLKLWTQNGPLGLDLEQRPLNRARSRMPEARDTPARHVVPIFSAERTVSPGARPTVIGFLM